MAATTTAPPQTVDKRPAKKKRGSATKPKTPWWLWIVVTVIVVFCLFPFYWMINISLKTGADLTSGTAYPPDPTLKNYQSIFQNGDFTRALLNSAVVSVATTTLALVVGSFCAYALARLRFRGKFAILALVLSITTFPAIAIAAPLFRLWSDIGIYNTWIGLIIPNLTFALPLTIYILVSFFKEIPRDLEEAALVDGATYFQAFRKVVVPLAAPGLATAGILTFIGVWNEFLFVDHAHVVLERAHRPGGDRVLHRVDAVRVAPRDDLGGIGRHLGPADLPRAVLPEAHRRGPDRRRGQGLKGATPTWPRSSSTTSSSGTRTASRPSST